LEATSTLKPDLGKYLPRLTDVLLQSELTLAKILTERSFDKVSTAQDARDLEAELLSHLAKIKGEVDPSQKKMNGRRAEVIAWLRILYVAIKWFQSHGYELKTTWLPITVTPDRSPFSQDRVDKIADVESWRTALFQGIKDLDHKEDSESAIAMIALSSILCGCLLNVRKLKMMLSSLQRPIEIAGSLSFFDFDLPYRGRPNAQIHRWFIDPLTEMLIVNSRIPLKDSIPSDSSLFSNIEKFLKRNGCSEDAIPKTLNSLVDGASSYWESRTTMIDVQFIRQRFLSHSLTHRTWLRINNCVEPEILGKPAAAKAVRINETDSNNDFTDSDADDLAEDSIAGIDWLAQISDAITSGQIDAIRTRAGELIQQHQGNAASTYLGWLIHLFDGKSSSGTPLAESTIYKHFSLVTPMMISMLGTENPKSWGLDDLTEAYQGLLIEYEGKHSKTSLSKGLREFQHYLSQENAELRLKETRDLLGDEAVLSPVEARIITFDEYDSAKAHLIKRVIELDQDRVDAALLVLILTFRVGLRRSEATKLLLADFHMDGNPALLIRPHAERRLKSHNSKRSIPLRYFLSGDELDFLRSYLEKRIAQENTEPCSSYVFAEPKIKRELMPIETIVDIVHESIRKVTGDQTLHLHHLRHSFGTWTYLKLRSPDHPYLIDVFSHLPITHLQLRRGKRLRVQLLGSGIHPVRGYAFAVARLLGHSGPNISLEHYLHCSDLVVWADTVRDFENSIDKQAVLALSALSQSATYGYISSNVPQLTLALRNSHPKRFCKLPSLHTNQPSVVRQRGRPKKCVNADWMPLVQIKDVLHLCTQNKTPDEIADLLEIGVDRIDSILSLAKDNQGKIELKAKLTNGIACPKMPRLKSDIEFFEGLEDRLKSLHQSNKKFLKLAIDGFLNRYDCKQGDVVFRNMNELSEAKEFVKFIHLLGFQDSQIRLVIRADETGFHNLPDWQYLLNLHDAMTSFVPADFSNHPAYGKWLGIQVLDKNGKGHHKAFALAVYLTSLHAA